MKFKEIEFVFLDRVKEFFDSEEIPPAIKNTKWLISEKALFFAMINKTNHLEIRDYLLSKFNYILENRKYLGGSPADHIVVFDKISKCLTFSKFYQYNDIKFIKKVIDNCFNLELFEVAYENKIEILSMLIFFEFPKDWVLSLSTKFNRELDKNVRYTYFSENEKEVVIDTLIKKAALYKYQGRARVLPKVVDFLNKPAAVVALLEAGLSLEKVGEKLNLSLLDNLNIVDTRSYYVSAPLKIINSLLRKPRGFYEFSLVKTTKMLAINLLMIEKLSNPELKVEEYPYLNKEDIEKFNKNSLDRLLYLSNMHDPYLRSALALSSRPFEEVFLMKMDVISNVCQRKHFSFDLEVWLNQMKTKKHGMYVKNLKGLHKSIGAFSKEEVEIISLYLSLCEVCTISIYKENDKSEKEKDREVRIIFTLEGLTPKNYENFLMESLEGFNNYFSRLMPSRFFVDDVLSGIRGVNSNNKQPFEYNNAKNITAIANSMKLSFACKLVGDKTGDFKDDIKAIPKFMFNLLNR